MSSLSISGAASGLYAYLQGAAGGNAAPAAGTAGSTSKATSTSGTASSTTSKAISKAVRSTRHHHGGRGAAFKQIEDAVTTALQSAQPGASDPNQTIEDAIAKVFKNIANSSSSAAAGTTGSGADSESGDSPASAIGSENSTSHQAFLSALQSFGVSPQQFKNDILSAVKDAMGGEIDPAAAMKSLPLGSMLDMTG